MELELSGIGLGSAAIAGAVSFLSPCVLPLVPGYVSFVAGRSLDDVVETRDPLQRLRVIGLSLTFVLGFSIIFISFGASASAIGSLFQAYRFEANYVAGAVVIAFGLHMMGILRLGWMNRDFRLGGSMVGGKPLGAFVLGSAFAFGWTPCLGPILGSILAIGAATSTVAEGAVLLAVYSAGLAIPFLIVAAFTDRITKWTRALGNFGRQLHMLSGAVMILIGIGMITGYLTAFGTWLLVTFPIFQTVTL